MVTRGYVIRCSDDLAGGCQAHNRGMLSLSIMVNSSYCNAALEYVEKQKFTPGFEDICNRVIISGGISFENEEAKWRFKKEFTMRPTYYELLQLNPRLRRRSSEEVEALMDAIEECGYTWDPKQKNFRNHEISRSIRTRGLDMFTPEQFKGTHNSIYQEYATNPERYHAIATKSTWAGRLFTLFVLDLVGGWLILPVKYWLISLGTIIVIFVFLIKSVRNLERMNGKGSQTAHHRAIAKPRAGSPDDDHEEDIMQYYQEHYDDFVKRRDL
jgi:uncharacterized membrane protein